MQRRCAILFVLPTFSESLLGRRQFASPFWSPGIRRCACALVVHVNFYDSMSLVCSCTDHRVFIHSTLSRNFAAMSLVIYVFQSFARTTTLVFLHVSFSTSCMLQVMQTLG